MLAKESKTLDQALSDTRHPWADEKLDGWRCLVDIGAGGNPRSYSRKGKPLTLPFHISSALKQLPAGTLLDGELIHGTGAVPGGRNMLFDVNTADAHYAVFDVLRWDGADTHKMPLLLRKEILDYSLYWERHHPVFALRGGLIDTADKVSALYQLFDLREGVVIKEATSSYLPGKRVGFWRKVINPEYGKVIQ